MYFNEWHGEKLSQKREKPYKKLKFYRHDLRGTLNFSILSDDFFVFCRILLQKTINFFLTIFSALLVLFVKSFSCFFLRG